MHIHTFFRNILVGSLCFFLVTPFFANAQTTNQTQQQMNQLAETYVNYISQLMLIMPNNPALLLQVQKLLLSLSDLNSSMQTASTTTSVIVPTATPVVVSTPTGNLFPSQAFGVESTITSIDIYPSYNGNSRIVSKSDDNEEVVSYLNYNTDDHHYGTYDAGFSYYKDGDLLETDSIENQNYTSLITSVNYDIKDMATSTALVAFMTKNQWYTPVDRITPSSQGLDCYSDVEKEMADDALDIMLDADSYRERKHTEPISSITEYYSPLVTVDRDPGYFSTRCERRGVSVVIEP